MTQVYQLSGKADDGRIFVVGGDNYDEFRANVLALVGDGPSADLIIEDAAKLISGVGAGFAQATQNVQSAFPQAAPPNPGVQQNGHPAQPPSPPQQAQGQAPIGKNGKPMRWVPAGVSKKTGRAYDGFWGEDR